MLWCPKYEHQCTHSYEFVLLLDFNLLGHVSDESVKQGYHGVLCIRVFIFSLCHLNFKDSHIQLWNVAWLECLPVQEAKAISYFVYYVVGDKMSLRSITENCIQGSDPYPLDGKPHTHTLVQVLALSAQGQFFQLKNE